MCAHYHGQTWNGSELARSLDTTDHKAKHYLNVLTGTYMIRQLMPWFENLKKRQVKSPKIYIRDSGLLHALLRIESFNDLLAHPKLGASWEGFALEQCLSLFGDRQAYFWSTHSGAELDLLLFHNGKRLGFEFKYTEKPRTSKSMHAAMEDLRLDHLYVIHPAKNSFPLKENITALSLTEVAAVFEK